MNSDEVKRLRELEAAATPAPWTVKTYQDESGEWNPAPSWHVWDEDNLFLTFELRNHAPALLSAVEERDRLRDQLTAKPPTCIDCGAPADVTGQCSRRCQGVNITECQVLPEPNPVPDDIARRWAQLVAERDTARTQLATERAESERLRGMVRRLYLALRRVRGWGTSAPQDVRDCAEPVWMLGHYGVQWYDPAGGVKKELARWDDEPEPTIGERVEIYCRAIQELAALRKREADKLSAIAADIAPLNPPAPDSTVRRDGMVCTCGESERRWHLRDCPMSSAGKAQRKEGEK